MVDDPMDDVLLRRARLSPQQVAESRERRLQAQALQEIEGNPLSVDQVAMFEMFEREGWTHEQCRAHILNRAKAFRDPTVKL